MRDPYGYQGEMVEIAYEKYIENLYDEWCEEQEKEYLKWIKEQHEQDSD